MAIEKLLQRAIDYKVEEGVRRGDLEVNLPKIYEDARKYFREWDEENYEEKQIREFDNPREVWIYSGIGLVYKIEFDENEATYHYKVKNQPDYSKVPEDQDFSVTRARCMPLHYDFVWEDPNHQSYRLLKGFFDILLSMLTYQKDRHWIVNDRYKFESAFEEKIDRKWIHDSSIDNPKEKDRLIEGFKEIFRGSNVDEKVGLKIKSTEDEMEVHGYDENPREEPHLVVTDTLLTHIESEDKGMSWLNRWHLINKMYKTKKIQREMKKGETYGYDLEFEFAMYPNAKKFGYRYKIERIKSDSLSKQNRQTGENN